MHATVTGQAARAQLSFKQWIEHKAASYAAIGLIVALVIRSSQFYSFGALSVASLPWWLQKAIIGATGLSIALACELLMSAAGAQWYRLRREAIALQFDASLPKAQRALQVAAKKAEARLYLCFTALGFIASVIASLFFAFTTVDHPTLAQVSIDTFTTFIIAGGVFFFGVIYEPPTPDATKVAQGAIAQRLQQSAEQIAGKIADGSVSAEELAFLASQSSPTQAKQLRALMPREDGTDYYDAPRIAQILGCAGDETWERRIRRILAQAAKNGPASGVVTKATGRGLQASQSAFMALFGDEVGARIRAASDRALNGRSTAQEGAVLRLAAASDGQRADAPRRVGVAEA